MIPYYLVRFWKGKKPLYCNRFQIDENGRYLQNWFQKDFKKLFIRNDMTHSVIISALTLLVCCHIGFPKCIPWLLIMLSGWILAKAQETRVFTICLVPITYFILYI